jgi:hypothetical protein
LTAPRDTATSRPGQSRPGTSAPERSRALVTALERATRLSGRRSSEAEVSEDVAAARAELSRVLVAGREARGLAREHLARVTRIPLRTLENLEDGRWDELPADVFVRGFLRSYAKSVGLPVDEVLARYGGCGFAAAPVASVAAQALLETMAPLAPVASRPMGAAPITPAPRILGSTEMAAVEPPPEVMADVAPEVVADVVASSAGAPSDGVVASTTAPIKRRTTKRAATVAGPRERDARGRFIRKSVEMTVVIPDEVRAEAAAFDDAEVPQANADDPAATNHPAATNELAATKDHVQVSDPAEAGKLVAAGPSAPAAMSDVVVRAEPVSATVRVMPPRPSRPMAAPTLVIDDDHPEEAERTREDRARAKDGGWRSFLPPALLDQERGGRQGGLTLAVIILLIVATLTLSYLMRRPSSTGEGITAVPTAPRHG